MVEGLRSMEQHGNLRKRLTQICSTTLTKVQKQFDEGERVFSTNDAGATGAWSPQNKTLPKPHIL